MFLVDQSVNRAFMLPDSVAGHTRIGGLYTRMSPKRATARSGNDSATRPTGLFCRADDQRLRTDQPIFADISGIIRYTSVAQ